MGGASVSAITWIHARTRTHTTSRARTSTERKRRSGKVGRQRSRDHSLNKPIFAHIRKPIFACPATLRCARTDTTRTATAECAHFNPLTMGEHAWPHGPPPLVAAAPRDICVRQSLTRLKPDPEPTCASTVCDNTNEDAVVCQDAYLVQIQGIHATQGLHNRAVARECEMHSNAAAAAAIRANDATPCIDAELSLSSVSRLLQHARLACSIIHLDCSIIHLDCSIFHPA